MFKKLFTFIFLLIFVNSSFGKTDSLLIKLNAASTNAERIKIFGKKLSSKKNSAETYSKLMLQFDSMLSTFKEKKDIAAGLLEKGRVLFWRQEHSKSIELFFEALKHYEAINNKAGEAKAHYEIGAAMREIKNYKSALPHFYIAVQLSNDLKDYELLSNAQSGIGAVFKDQSNFDSSVFHHKIALKHRLDLKNEKLIAGSYNDIGLAYKNNNDPETAIDYLKKSLELREKLNDTRGIAGANINIGNCYRQIKKYQQAVEYYDKGVQISKENNITDFYLNGLVGRAKNFYKLDDYKNASVDFFRYVDMKDSVYRKDLNDKLSELEVSYQSQKKDAELVLREEKLKNQQNEIKKQKIFTTSVAAVLVLVTLLVFIVYRNYRINKRNALELAHKNELIGQKNKEITDSINYARRIQSSLLSSGSSLSGFASEHFILYKPKDIVSGDFYWIHSVNSEKTHTDSEPRTASSELLIAAADCTGHGVPGAFMSLVGKENLDKAASLSTAPGEILSTLNKNVKKALQQDSGEISRDGMDVALVKLQNTSGKVKVSYAGANRPLWILQKNSPDISEIKATKHAIAGFTDDLQVFDQSEVVLEKGDMFYLFSDGYPDQFGGDKQKKLTTKKFRELLLSQRQSPLNDQKKYLEDFLNTWRGATEQIDDILVIGMRI